MQLFRQIEEIGTGYVVDAPMDVELTDYDIVQPDIIVVAESRSLQMTATVDLSRVWTAL